MQSPSPAPSVYSLTSSLREQSFRREYGRELNNYSEVYRLPADDEELDRLKKQHQLLCSVMGEFHPLVHQVMQDEPGIKKAALDLGCGCGSWIMDLARKYPNACTVAVDLVPMQCIDMPPNCRSEVDDINLGLEHFYGEFDLVHARLIASGIKDYAGLIEHISRVLRPCGLLLVAEWDFRAYDEQRKPIICEPHDESKPWIARWCSAVAQAARARGGHLDAANLLKLWCSDNRAFRTESVVHKDHWVPLSPWHTNPGPEGDKYREWGLAMREDTIAFLKAGRPLLLGHGFSEDLVDELEENSRESLFDPSVHLYTRVQQVIAQKKW
ncbi:hypothetical protein SISSUDRAFT_979712 [Sistotremastrum suecicum HHB10207 ss-3]|uniref:S-adenosyl-L-methionine-dependent methyltransferase n=1 Tax=Sistotremastrum suecicum HHB10207 ss-3 TaxID=1314776 RepID=A0A166HGG9_9AGAM|nr:hypothetical protein SISSUDRAFT_979712 [Sistotremastrum suecicum HHB10207 ss-3]